MDKLTGLKEEVKGKVTRKPDLVQHGKELRTGELKRKQEQGEVSNCTYSPDSAHRISMFRILII